MKKNNIPLIALAVAAVAGIGFIIHSCLHDNPSSDKKRSLDELREIRSMQLVLNGGRNPDMPDYEGTESDTGLKQLKRKNFIRDVVIEKNVVCAGEDFEVRVVMENPDGPEADLVCRLGDQFSNTALFNYYEPGDQVIDIYVRDGQGNIDARNLKVRVIECPEKTAISIASVTSDRVVDEVEFKIIGKRGISSPCAYEWEFGDGTALKTAEETITHDYGKRPQEALSSTFIVSVKATDGDGRQAAARTSITLINARFVSKQVGFAVVPIIYDTSPAFVDNEYLIQVKIKNIYDGPITFNEATVIKKSIERDEIVDQETVSAGSIMKKLEVKSGEIVEDVISIPPGLVPGQGQVVQVVLVGTFPDNSSGKGIIFIFNE